MGFNLNQKDAIDLTTTQTVAGDKKFANKVAVGTPNTPNAALQVTGGFVVTNLASSATAPVSGSANITGNLTVGGTLAVTNTLTGSAAGVFSGCRQNQRSVTANATLTATDYTVLADASSGPITVTLLTAATGGAGRIYRIKKIDSSANAVTIVRASTDTIYTTTSGNTSVALTTQGQSIMLQGNGTNTWYSL